MDLKVEDFGNLLAEKSAWVGFSSGGWWSKENRHTGREIVNSTEASGNGAFANHRHANEMHAT